MTRLPWPLPTPASPWVWRAAQRRWRPAQVGYRGGRIEQGHGAEAALRYASLPAKQPPVPARPCLPASKPGLRPACARCLQWRCSPTTCALCPPRSCWRAPPAPSSGRTSCSPWPQRCAPLPPACARHRPWFCVWHGMACSRRQASASPPPLPTNHGSDACVHPTRARDLLTLRCTCFDPLSCLLCLFAMFLVCMSAARCSQRQGRDIQGPALLRPRTGPWPPNCCVALALPLQTPSCGRWRCSSLP